MRTLFIDDLQSSPLEGADGWRRMTIANLNGHVYRDLSAVSEKSDISSSLLDSVPLHQ